MKTLIEEIWRMACAKAGSSSPKLGDYVIFRIDENSEKGAYAGVDSEGHVLLAVEVHRVPPWINMHSTALDYFRQERKGGNAWLMVLRLRREELSPVFAQLCQDLVDEIDAAPSEDDVLELVRRRLLLWEKLFSDERDGYLLDFQVKGLVAELLFMKSLLVEGLRSPLEIANGWAGPAGGDQDFQFSNEAIEVKAIGPDSSGVSISSLQQLEAGQTLRLSVWTLRSASPKEDSATTLNSLVSRLEQIFIPYPDALALFRDALLEVGYVENPRYDELGFEPMQVEDFAVGEHFPRLTPSSVPAGIQSATYVLSLQMIRSEN